MVGWCFETRKFLAGFNPDGSRATALVSIGKILAYEGANFVNFLNGIWKPEREASKNTSQPMGPNLDHLGPPFNIKGPVTTWSDCLVCISSKWTENNVNKDVAQTYNRLHGDIPKGCLNFWLCPTFPSCKDEAKGYIAEQCFAHLGQ